MTLIDMGTTKGTYALAAAAGSLDVLIRTLSIICKTPFLVIAHFRKSDMGGVMRLPWPNSLDWYVSHQNFGRTVVGTDESPLVLYDTQRETLQPSGQTRTSEERPTFFQNDRGCPVHEIEYVLLLSIPEYNDVPSTEHPQKTHQNNP